MQSNIPEGEQIVYSTLALGKVRTSTKYVAEWETHVLITNKGIAYTARKKRGGLENAYRRLYFIRIPGISGTLRIPDCCHLYLQRSPNEEKKGFRARSGAFEAIMANLFIKSCRERIQSIEGYEEKVYQKEIKKLSKEIASAEKIYRKWSKWLGKVADQQQQNTDVEFI